MWVHCWCDEDFCLVSSVSSTTSRQVRFFSKQVHQDYWLVWTWRVCTASLPYHCKQITLCHSNWKRIDHHNECVYAEFIELVLLLLWSLCACNDLIHIRYFAFFFHPKCVSHCQLLIRCITSIHLANSDDLHLIHILFQDASRLFRYLKSLIIR